MIGIVNNFLYKHGFMLLSEQNLVKEYNDFKSILNKIVVKYSNNLMTFFGIKKNMEINFMMPNLNCFNNLLKEMEELI